MMNVTGYSFYHLSIRHVMLSVSGFRRFTVVGFCSGEVGVTADLGGRVGEELVVEFRNEKLFLTRQRHHELKETIKLIIIKTIHF
jgi:hypothetical protein